MEVEFYKFVKLFDSTCTICRVPEKMSRFPEKVVIPVRFNKDINTEREK